MKTTKNSTWNQKLQSESFLKAEVRSIFRSAKRDLHPHKYILNFLNQRVYSNPKYTTLPKYIQSEIKGYIVANFDVMYDYTEFVHWYDGKFVGKELPYGEGFKQELINESSFVYKGTENKY